MTAPTVHGHPHPVAGGQARVGEDLAEDELEVLVGSVVGRAVQLLEGGPVALVQDEQRPVAEHLVDELVEEAPPRFGRHRGRVDRARSASRPNSCSRMCRAIKMSSLLAKW